MFLQHLAIDAEQVFLAPVDLGRDAPLRQARFECAKHLAHHLAPIAARRLNRPRQHLVAHRVLVHERQFLQLAIQAVEAQPIGDRRVDFERFAGDATSLGGTHAIEGAHVVQTIGELDEDDAQVGGHRQQHLAEVLRLRFLVRAEFHLVELGEPVHQLGGDLAESLGHLLLGDEGVLHDVMEERGDQRLGVELPVGHDVGDGHRVRNVGVAADAVLTMVGFGGVVIRGLDAPNVFRAQIAGDFLAQTFEVEHRHARHGRSIGLGYGATDVHGCAVLRADRGAHTGLRPARG